MRQRSSACSLLSRTYTNTIAHITTSLWTPLYNNSSLAQRLPLCLPVLEASLFCVVFLGLVTEWRTCPWVVLGLRRSLPGSLFRLPFFGPCLRHSSSIGWSGTQNFRQTRSLAFCSQRAWRSVSSFLKRLEQRSMK